MSGNDWLHLVCGLPGAGKTTLARKLEEEHSAVRLSPDEWIEPLLADVADRAEMDRIRPTVDALQWRLAKRLLQLGSNVVMEQGFWHREERQRYCEEATALGARVALHFLEVSIPILKARILERNKALPPGSFHVEPHELDLWNTWFTAPDEKEAQAFDAFHRYQAE